MSDDLWGDIPDASDIITPLEILKEQAKILATKTRNKLIASIKKFPPVDESFIMRNRMSKPNIDLFGMDFHYDFELVVPSLNNYSYSLLEIAHGVNLYPVLVFNWTSKLIDSCATAEEYRNSLAVILQSEKTRNIIASLLRQAST